MYQCKGIEEYKNWKQKEIPYCGYLRKQVELAEMMSVISEVEENFNKIREAEKYLFTQSSESGEMSQDTKTRINENFKMINEILQRNRAQLADLRSKYDSSNKQIALLKNTIERLNRELEESAARMKELQGLLAERDSTIVKLSSDITALASEAEAQSVTIQEQDKALHTAYYVFGTANELKDQKILSGGFLRPTRVMQDTFNTDYFLKIDIRVTEIPLYAKRANYGRLIPKEHTNL